ncbi:Dual specificity tyrosine-phosphorylation-regulated kinase [Rhizophlyctis rosea]|nr:Dual specificity tyrosine-phosphorylation-regulated kinase [Rhizophlyctis rosea]
MWKDLGWLADRLGEDSKGRAWLGRLDRDRPWDQLLMPIQQIMEDMMAWTEVDTVVVSMSSLMNDSLELSAGPYTLEGFGQYPPSGYNLPHLSTMMVPTNARKDGGSGPSTPKKAIMTKSLLPVPKQISPPQTVASAQALQGTVKYYTPPSSKSSSSETMQRQIQTADASMPNYSYVETATAIKSIIQSRCIDQWKIIKSPHTVRPLLRVRTKIQFTISTTTSNHTFRTEIPLNNGWTRVIGRRQDAVITSCCDGPAGHPSKESSKRAASPRSRSVPGRAQTRSVYGPVAAAKDLKLPLTPEATMTYYRDLLTTFEQREVFDYKEIYFAGAASVDKIGGYKRRTGADLADTANVSGTSKDDDKAVYNHGYDDSRGDYYLTKHDHVGYRYEILSLLGKGSFGQVVKCYDHKTKANVALKIIRNKKRFEKQGAVEVKVLDKLKQEDPEDSCSIIHMGDHFYFRGHLCITFELLGMNLYEWLKAGGFRGVHLGVIRRFTVQILQCLNKLREQRVVHCDLKPENVLLKDPSITAPTRTDSNHHRSDPSDPHQQPYSRSPYPSDFDPTNPAYNIKVIDFGSSCFEEEKVYTYVQSRFYRSPEVILGISYNVAIDMWSVGCILAELYTGYPIFPGENEQEQLACIMEVKGVPEMGFVERGGRRKLFFDPSGVPRIVPNSKGKKRRPSTKTLAAVLRCNDALFLNFIERCLTWEPEKRMTPEEGLRHEWILAGEPQQSGRSSSGSPGSRVSLSPFGGSGGSGATNGRRKQSVGGDGKVLLASGRPSRYSVVGPSGGGASGGFAPVQGGRISRGTGAAGAGGATSGTTAAGTAGRKQSLPAVNTAGVYGSGANGQTGSGAYGASARSPRESVYYRSAGAGGGAANGNATSAGVTGTGYGVGGLPPIQYSSGGAGATTNGVTAGAGGGGAAENQNRTSMYRMSMSGPASNTNGHANGASTSAARTYYAPVNGGNAYGGGGYGVSANGGGGGGETRGRYGSASANAGDKNGTASGKRSAGSAGGGRSDQGLYGQEAGMTKGMSREASQHPQGLQPILRVKEEETSERQTQSEGIGGMTRRLTADFLGNKGAIVPNHPSKSIKTQSEDAPFDGDLVDKSIPELKSILKGMGKKVSGNKVQLIRRITGEDNADLESQENVAPEWEFSSSSKKRRISDADAFVGCFFCNAFPTEDESHIPLYDSYICSSCARQYNEKPLNWTDAMRYFCLPKKTMMALPHRKGFNRIYMSTIYLYAYRTVAKKAVEKRRSLQAVLRLGGVGGRRGVKEEQIASF